MTALPADSHAKKERPNTADYDPAGALDLAWESLPAGGDYCDTEHVEAFALLSIAGSLLEITDMLKVTAPEGPHP